MRPWPPRNHLPFNSYVDKIPESQAAEYANGILNALNQMLNRAQALVANGAPANPQIGAPAVTASSIMAALGPVNTAVLQLIIAATRVGKGHCIEI